MSNSILNSFINETKQSQTLWALQDQASEDWVVLDSINFEETDVMPLWSNEALAQVHCIDEWKNYTPTAISVAQWLEFWVEDLNEDGVIIGINWQEEGDCEELELADFTQALATIEKL
jgi:hypothetical protein